MTKAIHLNVQGHAVGVDKDGFICLTDMAKARGDDSRAADIIKGWLRRKTTIEFLTLWEQENNSKNFRVYDFDHSTKYPGDHDFTMSVNMWVAKTSAIGIYIKGGKSGGTYAHRDIAYDFCTAVSVSFRMRLFKEYQRLKEDEINRDNPEWQIRRVLSKSHYVIQTDAVKNYKIPLSRLPHNLHFVAYAEEADALNRAIFGVSSKEWRESHPDLAIKGKNIRDYASINELCVLTTIEGMNAEMIKAAIPYDVRLDKLRDIAKQHMAVMNKVDIQKSFRRTSEGHFKPMLKAPGDKAA